MGGGWSSGAPGGEAAAGDGHRPADGPGGGPSSSLVEKASWAGHGRPASASGPAPWEQPRALSLREFPSLAAAAAASQQPGHRSSGPPAPEHGAWDEDERGRGPPGGGDRGRSPRRDGPYAGDDGYGYGRPPPHYGRRPDFSPPPWEREHRRFDGEEPAAYGRRYGREREPPHGYHDRGPHGWRDEPPPRDWRHDRCGGSCRLPAWVARAAGRQQVACGHARRMCLQLATPTLLGSSCAAAGLRRAAGLTGRRRGTGAGLRRTSTAAATAGRLSMRSPTTLATCRPGAQQLGSWNGWE